MRKQNIASDRRGPEAGDGFFHAVSLSGGKDSTCLLLLMIEHSLPIDAVIWADTGMEFPEMYAHIARIDEHLYRERGLHITALRSPKSFEYMMFDEPKQKSARLAELNAELDKAERSKKKPAREESEQETPTAEKPSIRQQLKDYAAPARADAGTERAPWRGPVR